MTRRESEIPTPDTLDGRSAAMEKSVAESRAQRSKTMDGYLYRIKVQNTSAEVVEIVFWEYRFHRSGESRSDRASTVPLRRKHCRGQREGARRL